MTKDTRNLLVVSVFVLVTLLPFINKPFNVDDPFYIKMAEQIIRDPLRPYSFAINWSGELRNVWSRVEATFPPLIPGYIALIIRLFGSREWVLHLFFLPFPLLAAGSMYFLSKRFVARPLVPALLTAAAPSFIVSSTGLMLDVPLLAFSLLSLALFVYGVDRRNRAMLLAGSIIAGAAILVKYTAFIIIPLFMGYLIFCGGSSGRTNDLRGFFIDIARGISRFREYAVFLLVPLVFFGAWCLHNLLVYGGMHFFIAAGHVGKGISLHKLAAAGTFFSGCLVFPFLTFFLVPKKQLLTAGILFALLFAGAFAVFRSPGSAFYFGALCAATVCFTGAVLFPARVLDRFIVLWFLLALTATILLEPWISGRYLLLLLPPSAILFEFLFEKTASVRLYTTVAVTSVALTAVIGSACGIADYQWARVYPRIAAYVSSNSNGREYVIGHFGMQYYGEERGMEPLEVSGGNVAKGVAVAVRLCDPQRPAARLLARMVLREAHAAESAFPLRVMSTDGYAGFYSSFWGIFPYILSRGPLEEFAVYEIRD